MNISSGSGESGMHLAPEVNITSWKVSPEFSSECCGFQNGAVNHRYSIWCVRQDQVSGCVVPRTPCSMWRRSLIWHEDHQLHFEKTYRARGIFLQENLHTMQTAHCVLLHGPLLLFDPLWGEFEIREAGPTAKQSSSFIQREFSFEIESRSYIIIQIRYELSKVNYIIHCFEQLYPYYIWIWRYRSIPRGCSTRRGWKPDWPYWIVAVE